MINHGSPVPSKMQRTAVLNVVGLTRSLLARMPRLSGLAQAGSLAAIRSAFPAVTCSAQAAYLTGLTPAEHGIVANGWYDRDLAEVHFWKQSNKLMAGPKLWDKLRARDASFTCAQLFWWFNMNAAVDWSITPRPLYPADGRKIFDIHTSPFQLRPDIKRDLGEFPFRNFWGPAAGIESSRWIADSARWIEERHQPTLNLVYLPHLDYNLQRLGPDDVAIENDLRLVDDLVGDLADFFRRRDIQVVILSEYGITPVDAPVHLNRLFRQRGWLALKDELGLETLDCGASRVFAVADHQIAHVYLHDSALASEVRAALETEPGIETILDQAAQKERGLRHRRAGDFIVIAKPRSWFTYYYWQDDAVAPDFARTVDIHRKIGYDPCELFLDPTLRWPKARVAAFLLKKKLGLRALLEVVPLDATLVHGSHGRLPENEDDWPVIIAPDANSPTKKTITAQDVHDSLLRLVDPA